MNLYKIVFEGKIAQGHSIEDVKKRLALLYNVDLGEIQRLFTGSPINIKKDLDYQAAIKDKETFEKTGAVCKIEAMDEEKDPASSATGDEEPDHSKDADKSRRPISILEPPPLKTNKRRYTIIHALFMSFFSKSFYKDVGQNWKNYAFLYLLFLLALCSVVKTVKIHHGFVDLLANHSPGFISQIPDITFSQGKASINQDEPYFIKDPESGEDIAIIDTTGQITSLNDTNAVALLTETKLIIKKNERETQVFDLSEIGDFRLDQNVIYEWLKIIQKWFAVALFPFLLIGSFVYRFIQVLIYGIGGMLFSKILKTELEFQSLISITIMAITPVVLLDTLLGAPGTSPVLWRFVCFLIAMGFLFFGIKANSDSHSYTNSSSKP